jgi:phosphoadenosine phosphosulfate reductase
VPDAGASFGMNLDGKIAALSALLERVQRDYAPATFASSLGAEDMVITDMIARHFPAIEIFTLDTGRLPEETHRLMQSISERYSITLRVFVPDQQALEIHLKEHGANAFYRSVDLRKTCCHLRKVEPLRRALSGKRAWITGMRRDQALSRSELAVEGYDADNGLHKFNPLADWSQAEVWDYLRRFDVPYNALHDRGYPSIGCAPCTRAITVGEDVRAGRWWWEHPEGKECGLHVSVLPVAGPATTNRRVAASK